MPEHVQVSVTCDHHPHTRHGRGRLYCAVGKLALDEAEGIFYFIRVRAEADAEQENEATDETS